MDRATYTKLKGETLEQIASQLRLTEDYPPVPEPGYPLFPDALMDVLMADPLPRCFNCQKPGYYYPADRAYAPGHCYSESGRKEFLISQCCEFCFDFLFDEERLEQEEQDRDSKPEPGEPGFDVMDIGDDKEF